jgi:hypothetical protein
MELLAGFAELLFLLNMLWIAIGVPLWLVLGAVTYLGGRKWRAEPADAIREAGASANDVTRLGRPALVIALAIVALIAVIAGVISIVSGHGDQSSILGLLLRMAVTAVLAVDVLSAALAIVLVAIARDVVTGRRSAGRETMAAYITITATYAVLLGSAFLYGLYNNLVPR